MQNTVFFSWQSDLPNNKNRSFIESCLLKAIKYLKNNITYNLDINIDRDTQSRLGTPDITESIFDKIDKCSFFIADVSIINGKSRKYKRTPNPNVLIELGYAAKKLSWERIICVFNTEFGKIVDLPFDLRNRRILTYEFNAKNKELIKKKVESIFIEALEANYRKSAFSNELMDYYNGDIYLILLRLVIDFAKLIFGYDSPNSSLEVVKKVLNLTEDEIKEALTNSTFIGFQLFKSYNECISKLSSQLEKIIPLKNFDDEFYVPLVRLINTLRLYDKELNRRGDLSLLQKIGTNDTSYKILNNNTNNEDLPNRKVLLKKIDKDKGVVIDFGDFHRRDHIDNLINEFSLTPISLKFYGGFIATVLKEINVWIDNNDGAFIIDQTQLEIYGKKIAEK